METTFKEVAKQLLSLIDSATVDEFLAVKAALELKADALEAEVRYATVPGINQALEELGIDLQFVQGAQVTDAFAQVADPGDALFQMDDMAYGMQQMIQNKSLWMTDGALVKYEDGVLVEIDEAPVYGLRLAPKDGWPVNESDEADEFEGEDSNQSFTEV